MDISKAEKSIAILTKKLTKAAEDSERLKKQMDSVGNAKIDSKGLKELSGELSKADIRTKTFLKSLTEIGKRKISSDIYKDSKKDIEQAENTLKTMRMFLGEKPLKFLDDNYNGDLKAYLADVESVKQKWLDIQEQKGKLAPETAAAKHDYEAISKYTTKAYQLLKCEEKLAEVRKPYDDAVAQENTDFESKKAEMLNYLSEQYNNTTQEIARYNTEIQSAEDASNLYNSILQFASGVQTMGIGFEVFEKAVLNVISVIPGLNTLFNTTETTVRHVGSALNGIGDIVSGFTTIISGLAPTISTLVQNLPGVSQISTIFQNVAAEVQTAWGNMITNIYNSSTTVQNIVTVFDGVAQKVKSAWEGMVTYIQNAYPVLGNIASGIGFVFQGVGKLINTGLSFGITTINNLKRAGQTTMGVLSKLGSVASKAFNSIAHGARGAHSPLGGIVKRITSMAKTVLIWRVLRSAMTQFRKSVSESFTEYIKQDTALKSSVEQLKASMATVGSQMVSAFTPLISVVVPYLQTLVSWLVTAANAFSSFIASLTGASTYKQASVAVDSIGDSASGAAGGLNDAADAANKLKEALGDYDELNVIADKTNTGNSGGGGGGGGNSGSGISYTDVEVDNAASEFAEKFKKAWEESDFTEIGGIIGNKLKEALEMIPWDTIKEYAWRIGTDLATLINGFVETSGLGETVGNTIAQLLNSALTGANAFVSALNFSSVGQFIADALNAAMEGLDWGQAIHFTKTVGTGIAEALNAIITPETFANVGTTVGNAVKAVISGYKDFVGMVDASNWGSAIASAINNFFNTVNWKDLGVSFSTTAIKLFDMFATAIKETDWSGVAKAVEDAVTSVNWGGIFSSASNLFGTIVGAVSSFILQLCKDAFSNFYDTYIKPNFEGIDMSGNFLEVGAQIIAGIFKGIGNALLNIGSWIVDNVFKPFLDGIKSAFGIHSPASEMNEPGKMIAEGLLQGVISIFTGIADWVKEHIFEPIKTALGNVGTFFDGALDTVMSTIFGTAGAIVATIQVGLEKASTWVADAWTVVKGAGQSFTTTIKAALSKASTWVADAWSAITTAASLTKTIATSLVKSATDWAEDVWTFLGNVGTTAKKFINAVLQKSPTEWAEDVWGFIEGIGDTAIKTISAILKKSPTEWAEDVANLLGISEEEAEKIVSLVADLVGKGWNTLQEWLETIGGALVNIFAHIVTETDEEFDKVMRAGGSDITLQARLEYDDTITVDAVFEKLIPALGSGADVVSVSKVIADDIQARGEEFTLENVIAAIERIYGAEGINALEAAGIITSAKQGYNDSAKPAVNVGGSITTAKQGYADGSKPTVSAGGSIISAWQGYKNDKKPSVSAGGSIISAWQGYNNDKKPSVSAGGSIISAWQSYKNDKKPSVSAGGSIIGAWQGYADKKAPSVNVKGNVTGLNKARGFGLSIAGTLSKIGNKFSAFLRKNGGIFQNGAWNNIPQYASGGVPSHGTMFVAGENGSEIVGNVGGRTEVLNKSQLASTMYSSVVSAMSSSVGSISSKITDYMQTCTNTLIGNINTTNAHLGNISHYTQNIPDAVRLMSVNNTVIGKQTIDLNGLADAVANKLSGDININNVMRLDGQVVYRDMVQIDRATYRQTGRSGFSY